MQPYSSSAPEPIFRLGLCAPVGAFPDNVKFTFQ